MILPQLFPSLAKLANENESEGLLNPEGDRISKQQTGVYVGQGMNMQMVSEGSKQGRRNAGGNSYYSDQGCQIGPARSPFPQATAKVPCGGVTVWACGAS